MFITDGQCPDVEMSANGTRRQMAELCGKAVFDEAVKAKAQAFADAAMCFQFTPKERTKEFL